MGDPRIGTQADPQAPFELSWLTSGVFAGFLQIYGIGGLTGTKHLDYLLSRAEATALYEQLGSALGADSWAERAAALLRDPPSIHRPDSQLQDWFDRRDALLAERETGREGQ